MTTTTFRFNRNYHDHDQIAEFMPAYTARYDELAATGKYPYNDSFKGHIPGIEGPDEDTAIYLCQSKRHLNEHAAKIEAALADGYRHLDRAEVTATPVRYRSVVHHSFQNGETGWEEWADARLLTFNQGRSIGVLPKGKQTRGHLLTSQIMVKV